MSKKTVWIFVIILAVIVVLFGLTILGALWLAAGERVEVRSGSVLEINLSLDMPELPRSAPLARLFAPGEVSLIELDTVLREASRDRRITAVYLKILPLGMSWAQIEEVRDMLKEFRKSQKKVHAYLAFDIAQERELYLAAAADEIMINPESNLLINGLVAEISFYKRMMNKLKIEPQFIMFKEFKNPENYTRETMTPEIRSMLEGVLQDIQDRFVQAVTADRKLEPAVLHNVMSHVLTSATEAQKLGLIDATGYEDEIHQKLMAGDGEDKEYRPISAQRYLKAVRGSRTGKHRVALIGGLGLILSGSGEEAWGTALGGDSLSSQLREIRRDKSVKGVLFRVDSPGGSAVGSDKIWREIGLLEKAGKPVVVSMSGVAGSGGYYISMGASRIVAHPSTITGSIGVLFSKFSLKGLYEDWLGITTDKIKLAPHADIFSEVHALTPEQMDQIRKSMENTYNDFVRKAAEGRKTTFGEFEPKAHGRIYTGSQAKALGLVDEMGGFTVAVKALKKELKIPENESLELVLYPKPKSLWRSLLEGDLVYMVQPRPSMESVLFGTLKQFEKPSISLLTLPFRID
ncbi:MAG: signal peptide peptidase SppA [Acidobacteriota bacterium]